MTKGILRLLFCSFMLVSHFVGAVDLPALTGPVMDLAGVLNSRTKAQIAVLAKDLNEKSQIQIQVLTVKNLQGLPIEQFSIETVEAWKLGQAATDKGVLFLVALEDRQMRIEVGQGLEGDLPDAFAKRIIEDWVKPYFQSGDFSLGVQVGVNRIIEYVAPDFAKTLGPKPGQPRRSRQISGNGFKFIEIIIFIIIVIFSLSSRGRRRGFWASGGGAFGAGAGGWSAGGGGGWSGGGGGFSGGGASGGW